MATRSEDGFLRRPPSRAGIAAGLAAAAAVALAAAPEALACPVCYGGADNGIIDGAKLSVMFLGGLVYAVIGGGVAFFYALRRHVRRLADPRHGLRVVHGVDEAPTDRLDLEE